MRTVENMIEELKKFPKDAMCYGYEGESTGLGIMVNKRTIGFIHSKYNYNCPFAKDVEDKDTEFVK